MLLLRCVDTMGDDMTNLAYSIVSCPEGTLYEPLLTIPEVCDWLSVCESTLMRLRRELKLIPVTTDGGVRYLPSDVRAYLAAEQEAIRLEIEERNKNQANCKA